MKRSRIALIALLLSVATLAFAQPFGGPPRGERMMGKHQQLKEALKLTDQQETQIRKLRLDLQRKEAQIHSKIQVARLDMKEVYLSDKVDRAAIEKSIKQVSDLQQEMKMNFVGFWFSVNGVLTPDQQKVWKEHVGGMRGGMDGGMRGGMDGGMRGGMGGGMRGRIRDRMERGCLMMPPPPGDREPD